VSSETRSPVENFKRAVSAATRAISAVKDLEVSFGVESPGIREDSVRLPQPSRDLNTNEVSQVRGVADSFALRLRHHDAKLHARRRPDGAVAQAVYDSAELARIEAIGALQYEGVARNLEAALAEHYERAKDIFEIQRAPADRWDFFILIAVPVMIAIAVTFILMKRL